MRFVLCAVDSEASKLAPLESQAAPREDSPPEEAQAFDVSTSSAAPEADPTLGGTRTAQLATLAEQADIR